MQCCVNWEKKIRKKCLELLETNHFIRRNHDPTKLVEGQIQQLLKKIKSRLSQIECYQLYPTGSFAEKFYGTAKNHKLSTDGNISNLLEINNIKHMYCNLPTSKLLVSIFITFNLIWLCR